ncbi:MAG: hypothetical protein CSA07_03860 [Bacteroidia bacterium]|nr:MAG: hypothetical protein CSA07_03860 [Bacteroidia bacterium]
MTRVPSRARLVGLSLALLALLPACRKDRDVFGGSFIPEGERLQLKIVDVQEGISTSTELLAPEPIYQFGLAPLGQIRDEDFGLSTATVLTELYPQVPRMPAIAAGERVKATFVLNTPRAYQRGKLKLAIRLLDKPLVAKSKLEDYPGGRLLLETEIEPGPGKNAFALELDPALFDWTALVLDNREAFTSGKQWAELFKGIRIEATISDGGHGAMYELNLGQERNGIRLEWEHKGDDGELAPQQVLLTPLMHEFVQRACFFSSEAQGAKVVEASKLAPEAQQDQRLFYVSRANRAFGVVDFSEFAQTWQQQLPISISRAELQIPLDEAYMGTYSDTLVARLEARLRPDTAFLLLPDLVPSNNLFDGRINRAKGYYSLNITLFVQSLLTDKPKDKKLYIMPGGLIRGYERLILGNTLAGKPMRLRLSYTKL